MQTTLFIDNSIRPAMEQQQNWDNKVLIHNDKTILIPARTKLLLKRIKEVDMNRGICVLNYTQLVWLCCAGLPEKLVTELKTNLKYRVGFDTEESFTPENSAIRESNGWITITYRGSKELIIYGDMTWVPFHLFFVEFHFELSHLEINLELDKFAKSFVDKNAWNTSEKQTKSFIVRFLLHENHQQNEMVGIKIDAKETANVSIAYPFIKIHIVEEQKSNKKEPEKTLNYYPAVRYEIAFYQQPGVSIISAYLPVFVLSFVGLAMFDSPVDLASRISNVAVLLLAYIAFIPSLRSLMPPVPYITMNDGIIGLNLIACLLILLESYLQAYNARNESPDIEYEKLLRQIFKIVVLIVFTLPMVIVFLLSLLYYLYWQRLYSKKSTEDKRSADDFEINTWFLRHQSRIGSPMLINEL
ncbi:UNKNOWN [Stylonychia lemnae]|uniref:Neurotransmitter-gated ion-channel ligand-binding domain-containing protein n=1 Tax=Stylonychia lemnae TaxID=5949 RepID=A0A078ALT5_STYLE|nr:UNKNOWN [Stylonychia lemnae]|eukprot:CDW83184.1 UNKNOWN [Stylonychia lemnae]